MKRLVFIPALSLGALAFGCIVQKASLTRLATNALYAAEVRNATNTDILAHDVIVDFLDQNGNVLESQTVIPCLRSLQHGATDFFEAQHNDPGNATVSARARVAANATLRFGTVAPTRLVLSSVTAVGVSGTVTVTGTATNRGAQTISTPKACAIARTSNGSVLRVVAVAISPPLPLGNQPTPTSGGGVSSDLGPGTARTFSISVTTPSNGGSISMMDVYADGLQDQTPIMPVAVTDVPVTTR